MLESTPRISPFFLEVDRFAEAKAQSRHSFIDELREQVAGVSIKTTKRAVYIEDFRVVLYPHQPMNCFSEWVRSHIETDSEQRNDLENSAIAWHTSDGWLIQLSLSQIVPRIKWNIYHFATLSLSGFIALLKAQQPQEQGVING